MTHNTSTAPTITVERHRLVKAMATMPYAGGLALGSGLVDMDGDQVIAWLEALTARLRYIAEQQHLAEQELRELKGQRAAIREFLGTAVSDPTA